MSRSNRFSALPLPPVIIDPGFNITVSITSWQTPSNQSHPFLDMIRAAVLEYRVQSPNRFSISIEVGQVKSQTVEKTETVDPNFTLWAGFFNWGTKPIYAVCRPGSRLRRNRTRILTEGVEVYARNRGKFVPLELFLRKEFPTFDHIPVGHDVMFGWWQANGKVFNWPGLPNEIKERVIFFCMNENPVLAYAMNKKMVRGTRAEEITGRFGQWVSLLGVSRQVRALCLRMCFIGSKDGACGKGLGVYLKGHYGLKTTMRRLSKCPQLLSPGALPVDKASFLAKELYNLHPRIYPELHRYATMGHAIRRIYLEMSFLEMMHFFRVTAGSFEQHCRPWRVDYTVFDRLPYLKHILIRLPDADGRMKNMTLRDGPQLFYGEPFNCPRILHRLIYERVAETLAPYDNVEMHGFMEGAEKRRYDEMRRDARTSLRFTLQELEELYKEDGGGVELEESVVPGMIGKIEEEDERPRIQDPFWPPKCRCKLRCSIFLRSSTN